MTMQAAIPLRAFDLASPSSRASVTRIAFPAFLLANAVLFLRPAEIISSVEGLPIYQFLTLICIGLCLPQVASQLSSRQLNRAPITVCVVGLLLAAVFSHLNHADLRGAFDSFTEFAKLAIYYLLFVTIIDRPEKLRRFLLALLWFTFALTVISLLQYHGYINVDALKQHRERWAEPGEAEGDAIDLIRLCGAGIFGNPNDLSRILVIGMICSLSIIFASRDRRRRLLLVGPLLIMSYALELTRSRGGLLALVAGLVVLFRSALKGRRLFFAVCAAFALVVFAYSGRQLDISTSSGTGQQRIQLWLEGFSLMSRSPLFGIGMNNYLDDVGLVAHNSFVQCFVELGLVGGTLFVGAFYFALHRSASVVVSANDELSRLRSCILAIVASAVVGMMSSTRSYTVPTYLVLGLASAYVAIAEQKFPKSHRSRNSSSLRRVCFVSAAALVSLYIYARFSVVWST